MWPLLINIAIASAFLVWYWARHPRRAIALLILIAVRGNDLASWSDLRELSGFSVSAP